jgi:hypothetical protein
MNNYMALLEKLGPELKILNSINISTIEKAGVPLLGEAIARMRRNKVDASPGYDGEFGAIKVFDPEEMETLLGQKALFTTQATSSKAKKKRGSKKPRAYQKSRPQDGVDPGKTTRKYPPNKNKVSPPAMRIELRT